MYTWPAPTLAEDPKGDPSQFSHSHVCLVFHACAQCNSNHGFLLYSEQEHESLGCEASCGSSCPRGPGPPHQQQGRHCHTRHMLEVLCAGAEVSFHGADSVGVLQAAACRCCCLQHLILDACCTQVAAGAAGYGEDEGGGWRSADQAALHTTYLLQALLHCSDLIDQKSTKHASALSSSKRNGRGMPMGALHQYARCRSVIWCCILLSEGLHNSHALLSLAWQHGYETLLHLHWARDVCMQENVMRGCMQNVAVNEVIVYKCLHVR